MLAIRIKFSRYFNLMLTFFDTLQKTFCRYATNRCDISKYVEDIIMEFKEKLLELRKKNGYSQEELGYKINVTRQTISNWELGITTPELNKIIELAEVFNITTDELLINNINNEKRKSSSYRDLIKHFHYEYKSKLQIKGVPLVHINVGLGVYVAKGIIAIGNISLGLISLGFISLGIIAFGLLALGLIALGVFSLGIVSCGAIACGLFSFGAVAFGYLSMGAVAIGKYSIGACAIGEVSYGAYARGNVAFDTENMTISFTKEEIKSALEAYGSIPKFIKNLFISFGK